MWTASASRPRWTSRTAPARRSSSTPTSPSTTRSSVSLNCYTHKFFYIRINTYNSAYNMCVFVCCLYSRVRAGREADGRHRHRRQQRGHPRRATMGARDRREPGIYKRRFLFFTLYYNLRACFFFFLILIIPTYCFRLARYRWRC